MEENSKASGRKGVGGGGWSKDGKAIRSIFTGIERRHRMQTFVLYWGGFLLAKRAGEQQRAIAEPWPKRFVIPRESPRNLALGLAVLLIARRWPRFPSLSLLGAGVTHAAWLGLR